jgi:translation initiation factor 2 gamma subunit (eIF-2gamma)
VGPVLYLKHELRNLDWVGGGAIASAQEVRRTFRRVGNVVHMVGSVKICAVPATKVLLEVSLWNLILGKKDLRRVKDIRSDATQALALGKSLAVELAIRTRSSIVATEVRSRVAAEAALHLVF